MAKGPWQSRLGRLLSKLPSIDALQINGDFILTCYLVRRDFVLSSPRNILSRYVHFQDDISCQDNIESVTKLSQY